jgi:hypothetical protein
MKNLVKEYTQQYNLIVFLNSKMELLSIKNIHSDVISELRVSYFFDFYPYK